MLIEQFLKEIKVLEIGAEHHRCNTKENLANIHGNIIYNKRLGQDYEIGKFKKLSNRQFKGKLLQNPKSGSFFSGHL